MAEVDDQIQPASAVAERYAQALFSLSQAGNYTESVASDLKNFSALIDENPDMQRLVVSPVISSEDQVKAVSAVLAHQHMGPVSSNFIKLVASKRRLFALQGMIRAFHALNDQAKGVAQAQVTVAEPLTADHAAALQDALRQVSGGKSANVNVKVDPSIIGGLVVKLGSRMVDASLKTKLNSLRTRMKEVG